MEAKKNKKINEAQDRKICQDNLQQQIKRDLETFKRGFSLFTNNFFLHKGKGKCGRGLTSSAYRRVYHGPTPPPHCFYPLGGDLGDVWDRQSSSLSAFPLGVGGRTCGRHCWEEEGGGKKEREKEKKKPKQPHCC